MHKTVERWGVRIVSAVMLFAGNNLRSARVFADPTPPAHARHPCTASLISGSGIGTCLKSAGRSKSRTPALT